MLSLARTPYDWTWYIPDLQCARKIDTKKDSNGTIRLSFVVIGLGSSGGAVAVQMCATNNDLLKGSISNLPPFIWVRYHSSQLGVSQTQLNVNKVQEFQN